MLASIIAFPSIALVYGIFVVAALSPSCFLSRKRWFVSEWLATLSYAIYLTHKACIHVVQQRLMRWGLASDGVVMLLCCAATSLLVALALHLAVERPCLRWRDRVVRARAHRATR
jgi:peptidoglycan/LPS O-acetylase OafA/YrhL